MSQGVVACAAVEELAAFVHRVLCDRDALDPTQTPLFRTRLTKAARVCGLVFHVEGPRLLRTSAVWSAAMVPTALRVEPTAIEGFVTMAPFER